MNLLDRIGGSTVKETVKLSLNRLFTNNAMSFVSLDGRSHGKLAFRSHALCKTVVGMMHCFQFWHLNPQFSFLLY